MSKASPDLLVEAHRIRSQRLASGLPAWDRRIDVKGILDRLPEYPDFREAAAASRDIAALLKAKLPARYLDAGDADYDRDLDEIVDVLESFGEETDGDAEYLVSVINGRLDELYDWADIERVWLGAGGRPDATSRMGP